MSRKLTLLKLLTMTATLVLQMDPAYSADPKLSLSGNGTVSLLVGNTSGETHVRMKAENLGTADSACKNTPKLEDLGNDGPNKTIVIFKTDNPPPKKIDQGSNSCTWQWTVDVKDLPIHSTQKRSARLAVGDTEQYVEYTLTNLLPSPLGISITLSSNPWYAWKGITESRSAIALIIKTGEFPVTNLRLAQAALLNNPASWQLGLEDLELCETVSDQCGIISIDARTSRTLYLRLKSGARHHGTYAGVVGFAVNERPDLELLNITVHASSALAKVVGVILLALGIWLAWMLSVWARGRTLRLEALKPVALLHESVLALRGELENAPKIEGLNLGHTKKALEDIDKSLTTESLDAANRLPPEIPSPFPRSTDSATNLQQHLATQGAKVDGLMVIIREGMKRVWQDCGLPKANKQAIHEALIALDQLGKDVKDRTTTQQGVQDTLMQYITATSPPADAAGAPPKPTSVTFSPPSTQHLMWEIGQVQKLAWAVWGVLATVGGVAVLILPNTGFGTIFDYIYCLFWGFGLPTTADKLQQIGPTGIASTIGVSLPKATS